MAPLAFSLNVQEKSNQNPGDGKSLLPIRKTSVEAVIYLLPECNGDATSGCNNNGEE